MKKANDIDLCLTLHKDGWSTCLIYSNSETVALAITHVFGDPFLSFIQSISQLINKENETTFFWYDEPGGAKIEMIRNKKHRALVTLKVHEFHEAYGDQINDFVGILELEIKEKELVILAYYQLKKIETLLRDKSFADNRAMYFPFRDFVQFEKKVQRYLKKE